MDIFSYCYEKSGAFLRRKIHNISLKGATQEDYEKLERKKTRFELILLSLVVFGIEICYAAETAFVTPILQKIGVPGSSTIQNLEKLSSIFLTKEILFICLKNF